MIRKANLGLAALSLGLILLPLTAFKPGLPPTFKADEPAYYLAAESLVRDFDLRVTSVDLERIFQSFPYFHANNVIVSSDDGWRTLFFGKPYLYSLAAAPFVGLWGAAGMVAFNMVLLVAMIWMGAIWLRRFNPDWLADLFSAGFFLLGIPFAYVFWLHPEVFNMFAAAACLFFGLGMAGDKVPPRWGLPISAACLAAGVYNKPMLAAIGLPICFELLRHRRWRHLGLWLAASTITILVYAAGSWALTGHPTAYLIDLRAGYPVFDPGAEMVKPVELEVTPEADTKVDEEEKKKAAGWWWILDRPHVQAFELAEDIPHFFFGRHTGLFVYQPFALLAFVLFFLHGRRRVMGWSILISGLLVGAFFMIMIPFNWHGGGGFVGNRYFVMACPAFIFIVTRIRPDWLVIPVAAMAGVLVGPLVLAPYGLVVPQPTLQSVVRNPTFSALPLEHSLGKIPGYNGMVQAETWLWGRKDHIRATPQGFLLVAGGDRVDIWIHSSKPIESMDMELTSAVAGNRTRLALNDVREELILGPEAKTLTVETGGPTVLRTDRKPSSYFELMDFWLYHLTLEFDRGEMAQWQGEHRSSFYKGGTLRLTEVTFGETDSSDSEPGSESSTSQTTKSSH